jgi:hypothetical protein
MSDRATARSQWRLARERGETMTRSSAEQAEYRWFGLGWARRPKDGELRVFLLERLRENPFTRKEPIHVRVQGGEVTLSGEVSSSLARRGADDDAWATPGVVDVHNHLRVSIRGVARDGPRPID